jgi:hypothetical protein
MKKGIDLLSDYKGSTELTSQYAKLGGVGIPTRVDALTRKVNMMGSNYVMNGSDKSTEKVNLINVSESLAVDNKLDKNKSTCFKNQDIMTIHSVVVNQDGILENKFART